MGRKQNRRRKYLHLCVAIVIVITLCSCTTLSNFEKRTEIADHMHMGDRILSQGDTDQSLKEYQKVISLSPHEPPADRALFNIGLIYAHPENSHKDYEKSITFFKRMIDEFPKSSLVVDATVWIDALQVIEKGKQFNISLVKEKKRLEERIEIFEQKDRVNTSNTFLYNGNISQSLMEYQKVVSMYPHDSPGDRALFNIGLIYAHHKNPQRDYKKSITFFKKMIDEFPESPLIDEASLWIEVLQVIEKMKRVDIEIEKKKKDLEK
ncbi:MAG: tetratricopeptide repeat protein [Deltaproteobacteria bacterium]|nr:tetratricopeptide repeat protein [Deltaproteobacteria bacterium]